MTQNINVFIHLADAFIQSDLHLLCQRLHTWLLSASPVSSFFLEHNLKQISTNTIRPRHKQYIFINIYISAIKRCNSK